jgi:hydrogenase expression/formation protein HypC
MCLGIPGKIVEIHETDGTLMATVDFGGVTQEVCVATVPEAQAGQYIIVHAGFALNILSEEEAQETLRLLRELETFSQKADDSEDLRQ